MTQGRILVVDDEIDISNLLRIYFTGQGFRVDVANRGNDALAMVRQQQLPDLIILDINMPDISGYDVLEHLRTATRTQHIPIIFLTQKDTRNDRLASLSNGADDYVTKPFDLEELKLRIQNMIRRARESSQTDPVSKLPTGRLVEGFMQEILQQGKSWTYIDLKLNNFSEFADMYGWSASDDVVRYAALMMAEVMENKGTGEDYIGHPDRDQFMIVTFADKSEEMIEEIKSRFDEEVKQHYSFIDRERGHMLVPSGNTEKSVKLMTISTGTVSSDTYSFSDIREVMEVAAENRRGGGSQRKDDDLLNSW